MSRIVPNEGETLDEARLRRRREYKMKYRENGLPGTEIDYYMRRKFGISLDDYDRMLSEQNGGCAVCGKAPGERRLHIDHDHATGEVRGLLCHQCNLALGCVGDDVDRLMGLVAYLLEHQSVLTSAVTDEQGVTP